MRMMSENGVPAGGPDWNVMATAVLPVGATAHVARSALGVQPDQLFTLNPAAGVAVKRDGPGQRSAARPAVVGAVDAAAGHGAGGGEHVDVERVRRAGRRTGLERHADGGVAGAVDGARQEVRARRAAEPVFTSYPVAGWAVSMRAPATCVLQVPMLSLQSMAPPVTDPEAATTCTFTMRDDAGFVTVTVNEPC